MNAPAFGVSYAINQLAYCGLFTQKPSPGSIVVN